MLRLLMRLLLALSLVTAAPAFAQDTPAERSERPVWSRAGAITFVGSVDQVLNAPRLGEFGVRYFQTDRIALGASLNLSVGHDETEAEGPGEQSERQDGSNSAARLRLWTETHLGTRRGPVSPYVAVGVSALHRAFEGALNQEFCLPGDPCQTVERSFRNSEFVFGSDVSVGAEVSVTRAITLGAAYQLGVDVRRSSGETTRDGELERSASRSGVDLQSGFTPIWLSVRL